MSPITNHDRMNGLSKRKSHRLLSQCQGLELTQTFPAIFTSQGEEIAQRIQKKEGAVSQTHPCMGRFLSYRRCVAQFAGSFLSKCTVQADRYRECLDTQGDWKPAVNASYVQMLHTLGVFSKKKKPTISELGAGSVMKFSK
jgi:hypothetical protein